jgi:Tfp pilus assembly protein PilV
MNRLSELLHRSPPQNQGFSFVEILISLFIVSISSISIYGLQKVIIEQNRNNVAHSAALELATEKMADVLQFDSLQAIDNLNKLTEFTEVRGMTTFTLNWCVSLLNDASDKCDASDIETNAGNQIREAELTITWKDTTKKVHSFKYTEQINPILVQTGSRESNSDPKGVANITVSQLKTNDIIYFDTKMGYKKNSFVIYNSELFKATKKHHISNGYPRDVGKSKPNNGWESFGLINNPTLLVNEDLPQTLFLDATEDEAP